MTQYVASSGTTLSGITLSAGYDQMTVEAGGSATRITVQAQADFTVENGGVSTSNTFIGQDDHITFATVYGTDTGSILSSGGEVDVEGSSAAMYAATVLSSGAIRAILGANVAQATVSNGGSISAGDGGTIAASRITAGGTAVATSGGFIRTTVASGKAALIDIQAGGSANYLSAVDDGKNGVSIVRVESGGVTSNTQLQGKYPVEQVYGGAAYGTVVSGNGAGQDVRSGGQVYNTTVFGNGANLTVEKGSSYAATIGSGGVLNVKNTGVDSGSTVLANGKEIINKGATTTNITISSGGTLAVYAGGSSVSATVAGGIGVQGDATSTTLQSGGVLDIASGGKATNTTVNSGATVYVSSGATIGDTSVASGGTISGFSGAIISGTITLADGATATIPSTAGGIVDLQGNTNTGLVITGTGSPTTVISGFSGTAAGSSDGITLADVKAADVTTVNYSDADHVVLTLKDGSSVTMNIIGVKDAGYTLTANSDGDLVYEVCFLADSMIATPSGVKAIQDLTIGDVVSVYENGQESTQKIVWAGRKRAVANSQRSKDEAGYPVRILKNAIAEGVPYKDMLITAEHCLFFNGKFVPARMLVNGISVFYDKSLTSYDYYHIETEQHSVIIADGMLTESYLDTGNRRTFRQDGGLATLTGRQKTWSEDAAAPLCVSRSFVEPIFHDIELRAQSAGLVSQNATVTLTEDADLHLVTDFGQVIRPLRQANERVTFMIPASVTTVRLVSRANRPSDTIGPFVDDRRNLGVLVGDISLFASRRTTKLTAHLSLSNLSGWHEVESSRYRWTDGNAVLPLQSSGMFVREPSILSIQVVSSGPYVMEAHSYSFDLRKVG